MKKFVCCITVLFLIFGLCSCSLGEQAIVDMVPDEDGKVLALLQQRYPDAEIENEEYRYKVISQNVDWQNIPRVANGKINISDGEDLSNAAVFIGEKTGKSVQKISVFKMGGDYENSYTESQVRVKRSFYGNAYEGETVAVREYYAVASDGDEKALFYSMLPIGDGDYLYIVKQINESLLGEEKSYISCYGSAFSVNELENTSEDELITQWQKEVYSVYKEYVK